MLPLKRDMPCICLCPGCVHFLAAMPGQARPIKSLAETVARIA